MKSRKRTAQPLHGSESDAPETGAVQLHAPTSSDPLGLPNARSKSWVVSPSMEPANACVYGEDKPIKASGELTIYEGTIDRANSDIYAKRVADT